MRADGTARGQKLLLKFERLHHQLIAHLIDDLAYFRQLRDDGRDCSACRAITLMVEQPPFT